MTWGDWWVGWLFFCCVSRFFSILSFIQINLLCIIYLIYYLCVLYPINYLLVLIQILVDWLIFDLTEGPYSVGAAICSLLQLAAHISVLVSRHQLYNRPGLLCRGLWVFGYTGHFGYGIYICIFIQWGSSYIYYIVIVSIVI